MLALQRQAHAASTAAPVEPGLSLEKIRFRHAVIDSNQPLSAISSHSHRQSKFHVFAGGQLSLSNVQYIFNLR